MIVDQFISLPDQIAIHGRCRGTAVAWQSEDASITWADWAMTVDKSANALREQGLNKGDRVAMLIGPTSWSWTHAFGVLRAGAVLAPLNTMLPASGVAAMLRDSAAGLLVVSRDWTALAIAALELLGDHEKPLVVLSQDGALCGSLDLTALTADAPAAPPDVVIRPDDHATLIYSSGTTGQPKGILHTHGARANAALICATIFRASATTRTLLSTPPHTNGSFMTVLPTVAVGGATYLSPGFTVDRYLDEVEQLRPTLAFMVPTMAAALATSARAQQVDWSCLDFLVTAGAPMPQMLKTATRAMTGDRLGELWGFTEGVATIVQPHEMADRPTSVGRTVPTCELRVIDPETLQQLPAGSEGELVGRSAFMMTGYLNRPDADTDLVWTSPEGLQFLRTGDVGLIDEGGWVTLRGRIKDMLISGGLNVFPIDIEAVLLTEPEVQDCAVVGVPHDKWGETPVAFVIPEPGADAAELRARANSRLAKHQRLHDVVLVDELPRNTLGKVLKHMLAADYARAAVAS